MPIKDRVIQADRVAGETPSGPTSATREIYYTFDDIVTTPIANTTIADSSGNGRDGYLYSQVVAGFILSPEGGIGHENSEGEAYKGIWMGSTQVPTVASTDPVFDASTDWSASWWEYANVGVLTQFAVGHTMTESKVSYNYGFRVERGQIFYGDGGSAWIAGPSYDQTYDIWRHIVFTYDATAQEIKMYTQGSLSYTDTSVVIAYDGNAVATFYQDYSGIPDLLSTYSTYESYMAKVCWWSGALSGDDISGLYNDEKSQFGY